MQPTAADFQTVFAPVGARSNRANHSYVRVDHIHNNYPYFGADSGAVCKLTLSQRHLTGDIKLRVVLLHIAGAVLGAELFDDFAHLGRVRDRSGAHSSEVITGTWVCGPTDS